MFISFIYIYIFSVSPIKSLCHERLVDWVKKFSRFGINCVCVTGDSDNIDYHQLINHNLIISTPEKWDSLTRKWRDNETFVKEVKLFMIDEVHLLNDDDRGSTLEVIVSLFRKYWSNWICKWSIIIIHSYNPCEDMNNIPIYTGLLGF